MTKDLQGSSHHLKVVGGAYGKRKDFIYELLTAYNATTFKGGVRTSPTTVMYTKGSSYQYDVSGLGLNLDTDFPHQRCINLIIR